MQPQDRVRRKNGRHSARRHSEHQLPDPRKMTPKQLIAEAEEILARQAHLDSPEANMLGVLLIGADNVEVIVLQDEDETPDAIPGTAEVIHEEVIPAPTGEILKEARGWLQDCFGVAATRGMTAGEIQRTVHRYYHGGWDAFIDHGMYR